VNSIGRDDERYESDEETDNGRGNDEIQGFFAALRMTVVGVVIKESEKKADSYGMTTRRANTTCGCKSKGTANVTITAKSTSD